MFFYLWILLKHDVYAFINQNMRMNSPEMKSSGVYTSNHYTYVIKSKKMAVNSKDRANRKHRKVTHKKLVF